MKLVCVEGTTLQGATGDVVTVLPASVKSTKVSVDKMFAYHSIAFTIVTADGFTGSGVLAGNSSFVKGGGKPFVLEDATATISVTNSSGATASATVSVLDTIQKVVKYD